MHENYRGLAAALLVVVLFLMCGCSRHQEVYLTGLESELEAEQKRTEAYSETELVADTMDDTEEIPGYVHICGAVKCPGVYPVYEGMRLFEVLKLAGGFTAEADEQWVNLAQTVSDGQRIFIYTEEETLQMKADEGIQPESADQIRTDEDDTENKVNINTADRDTLMTLPGIGETRAEAIIAYRNENGDFGSVEEIQNISGIKSALFSQIKDRITV